MVGEQVFVHPGFDLLLYAAAGPPPGVRPLVVHTSEKIDLLIP